jgi:hypothetical protein
VQPPTYPKPEKQIMRNDHMYDRIALRPEVIEAAMRQARVERSRVAHELFVQLVARVGRALQPAPRRPAGQCC